MRTRNKLLTLLILSSSATAAIAVINKCIQLSATSKNLLAENKPLCYKWRLGNVHYTKAGNGQPLLLIHDLNAASSGFEWSQIAEDMQKDYTVYTIDLLGCGRSEKINMTYTNYLYVQLITDFIKNVIGHRTSVIATGESASIPIMACANDPNLFDQIMLINPLSLLEYSQMPSKRAKFFKLILDFPVIGTLLYHIASSKQALTDTFTNTWFYNPYSAKASFIDTYYESAHLGLYPKSVYASQRCNYTKCNITNALKKIDNSIYLIGGEELENISERLEEYRDYNPAIEISLISETRMLPQLEAPAKLYELIKTYFR